MQKGEEWGWKGSSLKTGIEERCGEREGNQPKLTKYKKAIRKSDNE